MFHESLEITKGYLKGRIISLLICRFVFFHPNLNISKKNKYLLFGCYLLCELDSLKTIHIFDFIKYTLEDIYKEIKDIITSYSLWNKDSKKL